MDLSVHDPLNGVQLEEICSIESHVCCKCTGVFGTEEELKVHNETEHVPEENEPKLQTQARAVHGEINCDKCDFNAKDLAEYGIHLETHIQHKIYNCGKCEINFLSLSEINSHIDQQHKQTVVIPVETESLQSCAVKEINPVQIEPLQSCEICDFTTEDVEEFSNHNARNIHESCIT